MVTTKLYEYLAPYLPAELVTLLSVIGLGAERILLPKLYAIYSNASLDPHTLLPFIFSFIALYLSLVSIYHTFRATARLIWFGVKWSLAIVLIWFLLGSANELGHRFDRYQPRSSGYSWSKPNSGRSDDPNRSIIDSLKLLIPPGLSSLFEPSTSILNSLFDHPIQPIFEPPKTQYRSSKARTSEPRSTFSQFIIQNVREPIIAIVQEVRRRSDQDPPRSRTSNR